MVGLSYGDVHLPPGLRLQNGSLFIPWSNGESQRRSFYFLPAVHRNCFDRPRSGWAHAHAIHSACPGFWKRFVALYVQGPTIWTWHDGCHANLRSFMNKNNGKKKGLWRLFLCPKPHRPSPRIHAVAGWTPVFARLRPSRFLVKIWTSWINQQNTFWIHLLFTQCGLTLWIYSITKAGLLKVSLHQLWVLLSDDVKVQVWSCPDHQAKNLRKSMFPWLTIVEWRAGGSCLNC